MADPIAEAVDGGDLDEVVRLIDGQCASRDWDAVVATRDRCRAVIERGLQMWPAAEYAEYRLALEAPASYAGGVVTEDAGRFALGPLWEVAASTHTWFDIADHLSPGPAKTLVAYERVLRGDAVTVDDDIDPDLLDLPFSVMPWEPTYEVAEYLGSEARFPAPEMPRFGPMKAPTAAEGSIDEVGEALLSIAAAWAEQSNGTVAVVGVVGSAEKAIASLGYGSALVADVDAASALARMAWTGASGGAYGRRRGAPMGRFAAWWAATAVAGLEWPPHPDELGEAVRGMRWLAWEPADAAPGWSGSIAVQADGRAWALLALDSHREDVAE